MSPAVFPISARLERLERALREGHAAALELLASARGDARGVEALLAAAVLAPRSDLSPEDAPLVASLAAAVDAAGPRWLASLPDPRLEGAPMRRVEAFCGLAGLLDWTRGEVWMTLSERLDEAELAIALEAPGWWEADASELADLAHLDAVLALPEDHRARALLALVAASGEPEPPEVTDAAREAASEALRQAIPLSFLARDLALGALSASLTGGGPGSEGLLHALARGPGLRADTSEADAGPPVRVLLARPSDLEQVNLVLNDGVATLEWWSSAGALPDRCLVIAADGAPRVELEALARSEGRSRGWRLDVPSGDGAGFRFLWSSGRVAEVPLAPRAGR